MSSRANSQMMYMVKSVHHAFPSHGNSPPPPDMWNIGCRLFPYAARRSRKDIWIMTSLSPLGKGRNSRVSAKYLLKPVMELGLGGPWETGVLFVAFGYGLYGAQAYEQTGWLVDWLIVYCRRPVGHKLNHYVLQFCYSCLPPTRSLGPAWTGSLLCSFRCAKQISCISP